MAPTWRQKAKKTRGEVSDSPWLRHCHMRLHHNNHICSGNPKLSMSVCLGGEEIGWCLIHKAELAKEIQLTRSSRAECEWNMKDWQAAKDQIKNRGFWAIRYHKRMGMGNPRRRIWCSEIHKSESRAIQNECKSAVHMWRVGGLRPPGNSKCLTSAPTVNNLSSKNQRRRGASCCQGGAPTHLRWQWVHLLCESPPRVRSLSSHCRNPRSGRNGRI
jgi:hypothetical protein